MADEHDQETWRPRRGPVFKVVVCTLLVLIALAVVLVLLWAPFLMLF